MVEMVPPGRIWNTKGTPPLLGVVLVLIHMHHIKYFWLNRS